MDTINPQHQNLFLTGERNVGKTTLLRRVLKPYWQRISGFETLPYQTNKAETGYYLHALSTKIGKDDNDKRISLLSNGQKRIVLQEAFETFGSRYLAASLEDNSEMILMDELGNMEERAAKFQSMVAKCLDCSAKPVVGIIKDAPSNWLDGIRMRKDTAILRLNRQNAQNIENMLLLFLHQSGLWSI